MNKYISQFSNRKYLLIILSVFFIFNFVVFPLTFGIGSDNKPLDLQFTYTVDQAYEYLGTYSDADRHSYMIGELTADVIYPFVYSGLLIIGLFMLYKNYNIAKIPLLALLFDLIENTGIVSLINYYPTQKPLLAQFTSIATTFKWSFLIICLLFILAALLQKAYKKVFRVC